MGKERGESRQLKKELPAEEAAEANKQTRDTVQHRRCISSNCGISGKSARRGGLRAVCLFVTKKGHHLLGA